MIPIKKFIIVLSVLVIAFLGVWIIKIKQPVKQLQASEPVTEGTEPWWKTNPGEVPEPNEEYVLDPEIPNNYVPVINSDEVYMVLDEETGEILKYRQRFQKEEDGKTVWYWKDYNADIPSNYEAVEGLENVYKVTNADGTVSYKKYTRNDDNTFFFTDVDEHGLPLVSLTPENSEETPANFVRVNDDSNVFGVYDDNGVLNGYVERFENEESGGYTWEEVEYTPELTMPDVPDVVIETVPTDSQSGSQETSSQQPQSDQIIVSGEVGYTESETITNMVQGKDQNGNDCWLVYETVVTKKYDKSGELIATYTEGPTLINTLPYSDTNGSILPTGGVVGGGN